jgi:hypothetical protein
MARPYKSGVISTSWHFGELHHPEFYAVFILPYLLINAIKIISASQIKFTGYSCILACAGLPAQGIAA